MDMCRLWDFSLATGISENVLGGYILDNNIPIYDCSIRSTDGVIASVGGGNASFVGYPVYLLPALMNNQP